MEVKEVLEKGLAEIKSKFDETKNELKSELATQLENEIKSLEGKFEEIKNASLSKEDAQKMQEHLDKLDVKMQNVGGKVKAEVKSIFAQVEEKTNDANFLKAVSELKNNRGAAANFEVKAVGTMLTSNYT